MTSQVNFGTKSPFVFDIAAFVKEKEREVQAAIMKVRDMKRTLELGHEAMIEQVAWSVYACIYGVWGVGCGVMVRRCNFTILQLL